MSQLVLHEFADGVVTVTLNRPDRHNSLVPALLEDYLEALQAAQSRPGLRAAVLRANGRSFSTGGDALGFVEHFDDVESYSRRIVGLLNQAILAMLDFPVPIVAAVHGAVTGGSLGLVLASDLVLVSPETTFRPYYSEVGPSPDGGWLALLPAIIGPKRTAEVVMLNQAISAEQAIVWGLANRIVSGEQIQEEAQQVAQDIAAKKPGSIRHTKRLLNLDRDQVAARLEAERDHFLQQIATTEAQDGFRNFLELLATNKRGREAVP